MGSSLRMARNVEVELKTVKSRVRRLIERIRVDGPRQGLWIIACRDLVRAHDALEQALQRVEALPLDSPRS